MKKYWSLVADEADKLFVAGIVGKNDDMILSAGRLRGTALLASLEPVEALPAVRPLKQTKPRKTTNKAVTHADAWAHDCPECQAVPGRPCVSLRSTSTRRIGETLSYMHGARADGNRGIANVPPK